MHHADTSAYQYTKLCLIINTATDPDVPLVFFHHFAFTRYLFKLKVFNKLFPMDWSPYDCKYHAGNAMAWVHK